MSLPFGPPQTVSPLIRGLRYGLLFAGIFYGRYKQSKYEELEDIWREKEAQRKEIRDKQLKILKAQIAKEEGEVVRQIETGEYFKTGFHRMPMPALKWLGNFPGRLTERGATGLRIPKPPFSDGKKEGAE